VSSIKAKHDSAIAESTAAVSRIRDFEEMKSQLKGAISNIASDLKVKCQKLKELCPGFNFVDELHITTSQMEEEAKLLRSDEARKEAESIITTLRTIMREMQSQ